MTGKSRKWLFKATLFFLSGICITTSIKLADALTSGEIREIASEVTVRIYARDIRETKAIVVGSGVIIPSAEANTYYVLTNKHVAFSAAEYGIQTHDAVLHLVRPEDVIELPNLDLSWMKFVANTKYRAAELSDSQHLEADDPIYISGWPFSNNAFKFTTGEVRRKDLENEDYTLSYNAETENGMSGGPILDRNGRLVGVHGRDVKFYQSGIAIETFIENSGLAWVKICNDQKPPIEISLALTKSLGSSWETKGWYKLKPESCKTLLAFEDKYRGKIYYYAHNSDGDSWGDGPQNFCVNMESNFTSINREDGTCNDSSLKSVPMNEVEVYPEMEPHRLVNSVNW